VRDARIVGVSSDGQWLIIERDGEHLRLPVDDALRAAVGREVQMSMPLQSALSPREVQRRIRTGETAAHIAETSGVGVDLIARFEGPVLDERRWHAERARRTVVDGTPLEERFASALHDDATTPTAWDAYVDRDDGGWRVRASRADGRAAVWTWDTRTAKLRGCDDLARLTLSGRVVSDDLEAVLRPLGSMRDPAGTKETVQPGEAPPAPSELRPSGPKRRTSVPSWDEIMLGSTSRPPAGDS
jgi:hypothetical protein